MTWALTEGQAMTRALTDSFPYIRFSFILIQAMKRHIQSTSMESTREVSLIYRDQAACIVFIGESIAR